MIITDNPFEIMSPEKRWKPSTTSGGQLAYPPLVEMIRDEVFEWRNNGYPGISSITKSLLKWWFIERDFEKDLQYYFCQREAIESIIYLYEFRNVRTKSDLIKFDKYKVLDEKLIDENWLRFVIKMATGSGKTKVMSLALVWSYFHKTLISDSTLSTNFLIIAPYVIVLERLQKDFDNNSIFNLDPLIPENDFDGIRWKDFFQIQIHIQDKIKTFNDKGNIFLTNVQRIYSSRDLEKIKKDFDNEKKEILGLEGVAPLKKGYVDVRKIIKKCDDLIIMNDEAHHIHDKDLAWFKTIEDLNNFFLQNKNKKISLQVDFTATPKDQKGNIFPQTITDYPLVEAIHQNIVKRPILPSKKDQQELKEEKDTNFAENYKRFIELGVRHWKKVSEKNKKLNKKSVLFIMADETKSCEQIKDYLIDNYKFFSKENVLVIHTNQHGEFIEDKKAKAQKDLKDLRFVANTIDQNENINPYKVVISVLMLKEGWDVRNVTTVVGLRSYSHKAEILPEQTVGRGLRRMFPKDKNEKLAVIGTENFMNCINKLTEEGVILESADDSGTIEHLTPLIVEIDKSKDLEKTDIRIPIMKYRLTRDYSQIDDLNVDEMKNENMKVENFQDEKEYTVILRDFITKEISDQVNISSVKDIIPEGIIGFYTKHILKQLRIGRGFELLYPKIEEFIEKKLFEKKVNIEDKLVLKNLIKRIDLQKLIIDNFVNIINDKIVKDTGKVEIQNEIVVSDCSPFRSDAETFIEGVKTPFNYQVGNNYELEIAKFLSNVDDIMSYTKNYEKIGFYMDYLNAKGQIRKFFPDFLIKVSNNETCILETKGREDENDLRKKIRLSQWCNDMNSYQNIKKYIPLYIKQDVWNDLPKTPTTFKELVEQFK